MNDILDKAITLGLGLEKKAKETLKELESLGKSEVDVDIVDADVVDAEGEPVEGEEGVARGENSEDDGVDMDSESLDPRKLLDNKLVEDGTRFLTDIVSIVDQIKDKVGVEATGSSEKLVEKLNLATQEDLDVVREMARVAREKVDLLEKKIAELEKEEKD